MLKTRLEFYFTSPGSSVSQVRRYIAWYEAGKGRAPAEFARDLSTDETCQLLGACAR